MARGFCGKSGIDGVVANVCAVQNVECALTGLRPACGVGLDSIYVRDASTVTPHGVVLCGMVKAQREGEPSAQRAAYEAWGLTAAGAIEPPGTLEGGDLVWRDRHTLVAGRGYRSNDEGIRQLRGIVLVEVSDEEFELIGANVLAPGPRTRLTVEGCPKTRARLERAGADVRVYAGTEISVKGGGGPTCLTRPIGRHARGTGTAPSPSFPRVALQASPDSGSHRARREGLHAADARRRASQRAAGVDEKTRTVYFTANGRDAGQDPYFGHAYAGRRGQRCGHTSRAAT